MDKENKNIHIKKKSFIISLVLVSLVSIILFTTSIVSFTSNNFSLVNAQREQQELPQTPPSSTIQQQPPSSTSLPPKSPSQLQIERQQQELREQTSATQSSLTSKSPNQLQLEEQQEQQSSSRDTITTQAPSSTCSSIPIQFPISHLTYTIQADSLQNALFNFKFADPTSGAPQAAETRSEEPQLSGYQLDEKGRIICASAVVIPIEIEMPSWTNIGTLCPEIQNEWSSFLSKVSAHEQQHVNFIQTGFAGYGDKIIGKTLQQAKAIYDRMAVKVEKQHMSIDPPNIPLNVDIKCDECPPDQFLDANGICRHPSCPNSYPLITADERCGTVGQPAACMAIPGCIYEYDDRPGKGGCYVCGCSNFVCL